MHFEDACELIFARHETFYPRYGWLKKCVDSVAVDPYIFSADDAVLRLGVGKNMVSSIRHWGRAFKVIDSRPDATPRNPGFELSNSGKGLLGTTGSDPYLELSGSLWWLHWMLLRPKSLVPVWWLALNEFPGLDFTEDQLLQFTLARTSNLKVNDSSIRKDVSLFIRMYCSGGAARSSFEDQLDSPFRELGLISKGSEKGRFRFALGDKSTLPSEIVLAAVLDFWRLTGAESKAVNVGTAVTEHGSPALAFKLTPDSTIKIVEQASASFDFLSIHLVAGIPVLRSQIPLRLAVKRVLESYFHSYRAVSGRTGGEIK